MVSLQNKLKKTEQIEEKSLDPELGQQFKETYDFSRLWRIKEAQGRSERYTKSLDARKTKAT